MKNKTVDVKKMIVIFSIVLVTIVSCICIFQLYLQQTMEKFTYDAVTSEAHEYKNRLETQIHFDLELLNTSSKLITEVCDFNNDNILNILKKANSQNSFISMGFFDVNGMGTIDILEHDPIINTHISQLQPELKEILEHGLKGESYISQLYYSDITNQYVMVYAIPVYKNNQLIGTMMGGNSVSLFNDIVIGDKVMGGNGYIHMVNSDGDIVIRSPYSVVEEQPTSIFSDYYLSDNSINDIKAAMEKNEECHFSFNYHNKEYQAVLYPVGINGWYLYCVNTLAETNRYIYQIAVVLLGLSLFVGAVLIVVAIYLYYLIYKHNKKLNKLAYYDELTDIYNGVYFRNFLDENESKKGSIVLINFRKFKFINEMFSKEYGDSVLKSTAAVLEKNIKNDEIACHDHADYFYLYFNTQDQNLIKQRIRTILDEISHIPILLGNSYPLLAYAGVVMFNGRDDASSTFTKIMVALDKAKESYLNEISFYDDLTYYQTRLKSEIETQMHQALKDEEFYVYLQPKMDLKTGKLAGAEALVRWIKKDHTMIYPNQFIPLFEENGFCVKLDMYMMEKVCQLIRKWIDQGISPIPISVNQTKLLFFEASYINDLKKLIQKYNIPANYITIEILEGLAVQNIDEINNRIKQLHEIGFRVSLDDFGSGYSSLNILGQLNIDELKLDRAFLMELNHKNKNSELIMKHVLSIAKSLNIFTVVEGVETQKQEDLIKRLGGSYGQGYLYSKPIDLDEFNNKFMND